MWILGKSERDLFRRKLEEAYRFFDVTKEALPPKQYFFPPLETTFTFSIKDSAASTPAAPQKFALWGLRLRDLEAITHLDEIMTAPEPDYYYFRRRKKALLIGVIEKRLDMPPGGDIIISSYREGIFLIEALTALGQGVIKKYAGALRPFKEERRRPHPSCLFCDTCEEGRMPSLRRLLMDAERLKDAVKWSWKGLPRLWERLGNTCLGCGICTYVCPYCHCFSMEDSVDLSGEKARRRRCWDACTLPGFAAVAGGHSFHPSQKERYYNWFYHKFVRGYLEFGKSQCVACGRCEEQCPARIDIEEVLMEITSGYEKEKR
ncbi:MAG: 4Fe-4S dicluster domain-containing protein [Thermodesulfobacteriota bacterium]